jgi:putative monooxygenase
MTVTGTRAAGTPGKISAAAVPPNLRRGGEIRVLLSPKTVGATSGFLGTVTLPPGSYVAEHYHPYSEEFLYVVAGTVTFTVAGELVTLEPGDAFMVPEGARHRLANAGETTAFAVFHLSPLAPRPDLGHVDTEVLPVPAAPPLVVSDPDER